MSTFTICEWEEVDLAKRKGDHSSRIHPGLDRKPGESNWVDKAGGLPSYIERTAKHIHSDSGLSISHAIAAAVNRVKVLAAKGNAQAIKALAEWNAKRGKNKVVSTSFEGNEWEEIDLARPFKRAVRTGYSTVASQSAGTTGVRGSAFSEEKHVRSQGGQFANKISPVQLMAAKRVVEGGITNLQVGETFELPGKMGWVKRTEGGYFIQGPAGFTASVRHLTNAVQAAASIIAGKVNAAGANV
jgi:hypothetical protein